MKTALIDTNIIIRFLVEDRNDPKYSGMFELFRKIEIKDVSVFIDNLVIMESYFVLTKIYKIPYKAVIGALQGIIGFSGVTMENKQHINGAFEKMLQKKIDFVDAFLIELSRLKGFPIYTNDKDLIKSAADTISFH